MNSLESNIRTIQSGLLGLDRELQLLEKNAKKTFGEGMGEMRVAVSEGNHNIKHIATEAKTLLLVLEDGDPASTDLQPQMQWFKSHLTKVVSNFEKAESCADSTMSSAMNFRYQVQDINKKAEGMKAALNVARTDGTRLAKEAQYNLESSLRQVDTIQMKIRQLESQISSKESYCNSLKNEIRSNESSISDLGQKIAAARSKRNDQKAKGIIVGVGGGLLGLSMIALSGGLLTPLVGGMVIGGAGITVADAAITASDLKDEIEAAQRNRSSLQTKSSQAEAEARRLQLEKSGLDTQVSWQRVEAETRKTCHRSYTQQLSQLEKSNSSINELTLRASSTSSSAQETEIELQETKEQLEQFSVLLNSNSTELQDGTSSLLEIFLGQSFRRKRQLDRQKVAILQLTNTLDQIQGRLPALLSAPNSKLLEHKSSSDFTMEWEHDHDPMPTIIQFSKNGATKEELSLPWLTNLRTTEELCDVDLLSVPGAFPAN